MLRTDLLSVVAENAVRFLGHDTHSHEAPHLIHVVSGAADLVVEGRAIRLGPKENLWLAPHVEHSARYSEASVVFGPFLSPHTIPPSRVQLLGIVPDLTVLVTTILGAGPRTPEEVQTFRLALDDVLNTMRPDCFPLRHPRHPAARAVAKASVATASTLHALAEREGTSPRHIQRLFRDETGLSFTSWRARARLNVAVARLRGGTSLHAAAAASGYATRAGLLKALGRETGIDREELVSDPLLAIERWSSARERPPRTAGATTPS